MSDLGSYCRAIEAHLCQVNGGHLVRIVGPAFDLVRRWFNDGIPLKIVERGIERRSARASRIPAAARRSLRIEFCEADVLDVHDEWRRAVGFALPPTAAPDSIEPHEDGAERDGGRDAASPPAAPRGPSLPKHLERIATRLTSFLASVSAPPGLRGRANAMLVEVDRLRADARSRGDARRAVLDRLSAMDEELLEALPGEAEAGLVEDARREAEQDLAPYRPRMTAAAFDHLVAKATVRLLRARLQLPEFRP